MLADVISYPVDEQLDQCITQCFAPLLSARQFQLVDRHHEGTRTCYIYQSQFFRLQLCHDGGCISSSLAPLHAPCRYFDPVLLQALVTLTESPQLTSWHLRNELSGGLSCAEQAAFVDRHYNQLISLLRTTRYPKTLALIEQLQCRRAEACFWNKVRQQVGQS